MSENPPSEDYPPSPDSMTANLIGCSITGTTCEGKFTNIELDRHLEVTPNFCGECHLHYKDITRHINQKHRRVWEYRCVCDNVFVNVSTLFAHIEGGDDAPPNNHECKKWMTPHMLHQMLLCHRKDPRPDSGQYLDLSNTNIVMGGLKGPLFEWPKKTLELWKEDITCWNFYRDGYGGERFYCMVCAEEFETQSALKDHLKGPPKERPDKMNGFIATCVYCKRDWDNFTDVVKHLGGGCPERAAMLQAAERSDPINLYIMFGKSMYDDEIFFNSTQIRTR